MQEEERSCPKCGSANILPIGYGLPSTEMFEAAKEGKLLLGGCVVSDSDPQWHCKDCKASWRADGEITE